MTTSKRVAACAAATLLALTGCDSSSEPAPRTGTESAGVGRVGASASRPRVAMVVALPLSYTGTALQRLAGNGRAAGVQLAGAGGLPLPLSVSPTDVVTASERNFFGGDRRRWTRLGWASVNSNGTLGGHGSTGSRHFVWTWDGTPAIRYPAPPGLEITSAVGPSDQGMLAADAYDPATSEQQILSWQANGSRALLYRNVAAKAGMQLIGIASNGLLAAVERDGILLTLRLYDGQWQSLPFDYFSCGCEARRVNARGQVLLSPLTDRGGDPRGYLVSRGGATLLPRTDPHTTYADLNDLGDIVGNGGGRPIVILDGVLHDLNAYAGSASTGWQFLTAVAINARRQVLGAGLWQGQMRWYRLSLR